jgi:HAAS domain-containing protein
VVGVSADPVTRYLDELRVKLRTPDADLVLAEAEDHLREAVAAGLAIGMSEREAQEAAISAFGSVRAVVRAHTLGNRRLAAGLVMTALRLGWTGMFAVAASGVVAAVMNRVFGRGFVGGAPAGTRFTPAQCQHWLSIWHGAHGCAQAAMLESSSDAVSLRLLAGGLGGLALLGGYLLALRYWRRGGGGGGARVRVLPRGLFPLTAAAVFAAGALALTVCTFTGGPLGAPAGPGAYLSGAITASAFAIAFGARALRVLPLAHRG